MKHTFENDNSAPRETFTETGDSIEIYLREIARIPALSREDEDRLARRLDDQRKRVRSLAFESGEGIRRAEAMLAAILRKPAMLDHYLGVRGDQARRAEVLSRIESIHRTLPCEANADGRETPGANGNRRANGGPSTASDRNGVQSNGRHDPGHHGNGHAASGQAANGQAENGHAENGHAGNSQDDDTAGAALQRSRIAHLDGTGKAVSARSNASSLDADEITVAAQALAELDFHMSVIRTLIDDVERADVSCARVHEALDAYAESIRGLSESHLGLVVNISRRIPAQGLPLADLVQEGNTGLLRAADRFTANDGPFEAFARSAIQEAIRKFTREHGRVVRVPAAQLKLLRKLAEYRRNFADAEGREPTVQEQAEHLSTSADEILILDRLDRAPTSLDEPTDEEGSASVGDLLEDPSSGTAFLETHNNILRRRLSEALRTLSVRERNVLRLRFGLSRGRPHTLQEVAEVLRVSPSRARKLQANAIRKLQNSEFRAELEALLDGQK